MACCAAPIPRLGGPQEDSHLCFQMDPPISLGLQAELLTHFTDEAAECRELVPGSLGWWVVDLEFLTPPRALASLTRMNLADSVRPSSQVCPPEGGPHSKLPKPRSEE